MLKSSLSRTLALPLVCLAPAVVPALAGESTTAMGVLRSPVTTCDMAVGSTCNISLQVTAPTTDSCIWSYSVQVQIALSQSGQKPAGFVKMACPVTGANQTVSVPVAIDTNAYNFRLGSSGGAAPVQNVAEAATSYDGSQILVQGASHGASGTFSQTLSNYTRGAYVAWPTTTAHSMGPNGAPLNPLSASLLANKGVVGAVLVEPWFALEPYEGQFDWSRLDALIAQASQSNLVVTLSITDSQAMMPGWLLSKISAIAPQNLMSDYDPNPSGWRNCRNVIGPVFWDASFHQAILDMIRNLGARYAANPAVVGVGAQFANWYTDDWVIPSQSANGQAQNCGNTHLAGDPAYDPSAGPAYVNEGPVLLNLAGSANGLSKTTNFTNLMVLAGQDILNATAAAFPTQAIKLPIKLSPQDAKGAILNAIVGFGNTQPWSSRLYLQTNGFTDALKLFDTGVLTATVNSQNYVLRMVAQQCPHCGLQENAPYASGNNINTAAVISGLQSISNVGLTYQPVYFEFFQQDASYTPAGPTLQALTMDMGGVPHP